jgi:formate C-acetyltransferase
MRSVMKIPRDFAMTSIVLNMRFLKKTFARPEEAGKLKALFKGYFDQGGVQVQVNVIDAEELRRAEREPEKYASLIVRVGGYSDYYVNLSPALRAEILERTEIGEL